MRMILAVGFVCALAAGTAQAGTPRVNGREHRQQVRIRQGVRSGELTRCEATRLEAQQAAIRRQEARFRSDGVVTPAERARLNHELDVTNRRIYRQAHDEQDRE